MSDASFVDAHCHLDLFPDFASLRSRTEAARVWTLAVTNSPSVFRQNVALAAGSPFIHVGAGLHPQLVHEREQELPLLLKQLEETRFVGEVGLDYQTDDSAVRAKQRRVFSSVLSKSHELGGKIVSIHSRRAADDVVAAIDPGFRGTLILHWYSGSPRLLEIALERGCYVSVNEAMVSSARGRALVARLPRDRVLTESDGPFVRHGKGAAEPAHMSTVVEELADVWRVDGAAAARTIIANLADVLGSGLTSTSVSKHRDGA